jgi:hypothetical protein
VSPAGEGGRDGDDGGLLARVQKRVADGKRVEGDGDDVKPQQEDYPLVTSQPGLLWQ